MVTLLANVGLEPEHEMMDAVDFLIECTAADLGYWLRMLTTFLPRLMSLIAPRYAAKREQEERRVNVRKRHHMQLDRSKKSVFYSVSNTE